MLLLYLILNLYLMQLTLSFTLLALSRLNDAPQRVFTMVMNVAPIEGHHSERKATRRLQRTKLTDRHVDDGQQIRNGPTLAEVAPYLRQGGPKGLKTLPA